MASIKMFNCWHFINKKTISKQLEVEKFIFKKLFKVHSYIERHVRQTSPKNGDYRVTEYLKRWGEPL